jgi:iron complex outermembrane receptor protein
MLKPLVAAMALAFPLSGLADDSAGRLMEEIVVTAQKREETLQSVPISITAKTGDDLKNAGVTDIKGLEAVVPGLHVGNDGLYSNPTLRGVGSKLAGTGLSSNVATYVDGFYRPNQLTSNMEFLDVESIQVLKGPQGTLFGRNATGGAILVATKTPDVDTREGAVSATYGSYNDLTLAGYVSGGITETVAGSVSAMQHSGDGFVENVVTGDDEAARYKNQAIRAKLAFEPTDTSRYVLSADYSDIDDPSANAAGNYNNWATGVLMGGVSTAEAHKTANNAPTEGLSQTWGTSLKAEFDLSDLVTLTSFTQYRDEDTEIALDVDGTSATVLHGAWNQQQQLFTQEMNLAGVSGDLDWVLGAFYMKDRGETPYFNITVPSLAFSSDLSGLAGFPAYLTDPQTAWSAWNNAVNIEAYALFADGTYNFAENWFLTAGIRYSEETSEATIESGPFTNASAAGDPDVQVLPRTTYDESWDSVTGRLVLRYEFSDAASAYLSWGQGFKSGLFNANGLQPDPVDPEEITAYELGLKMSGDTWRGEVAAFYYDYTDLHVSEWAGTQGVVKNAAAAEIYGLEVSTTAYLTEQLTLNLGAAYTHAEYTDYENATLYGDPLQNAGFNFLARYPSGVDASGNQMIRTPEFSGNVALDYVQPVSSGEVTYSINYAYQSRVYFVEANNISQDPYGLLGARISWENQQGDWNLAVFGKNLTDEEYLNQILGQDFYVGQTFGAPRTFGVQATYRF